MRILGAAPCFFARCKKNDFFFLIGKTQSSSGEGLFDIINISCFLVQRNVSVSGPLVASYISLVISLNPGIQNFQDPAMPEKVFLCF